MINAKKSLGQNFLKSVPALNSIVAAGNISSEDIILEVGPGKGALTEKILDLNPKKLLVVEKDDRLIPLLEEKFSESISAGRLEMLHADILDLNENNILKYGSKYKLIANIPYYITGALIRKFLSGNFQPERMVLLLQKEVAKRIVARDEKESLLSLSVKVFGTPKYIDTVKAKYFSPEPNVDSAILLIENISRDFFSPSTELGAGKISEQHFFELLKAGFAHKRKVLIGNLKSLPQAEGRDLASLFEELKISPKVRAEDLKLEEWKVLAEKIIF